MTRILFFLLLLATLCFACGLTSGPTPFPSTSTPRPTPPPTSTFTPVPTPTSTPRPRGSAFLPAGTPNPALFVIRSEAEARNLIWAHLSRCPTFDPRDLVSYQVQEGWFVKAQTESGQQYGVWKVSAFTGTVVPHDPLSDEWERFINSSCDPVTRSVLVLPTATPMAVAPTPILHSPTEAINTVWAYLVKCFPNLNTSDFESVLDTVQGEYLVKDKNDPAYYGVWRIDRFDGTIDADNERARVRDQVVKNNSC